MSLREPSLDVQPASRPRFCRSFNSVSRPTSVYTMRPRTGNSDLQNSKSMFLKECSLYTCFLLAGWVDATAGALLPAIREHWDLSFVLVSKLFVGTFVGCIIAATFVSPRMDRIGYGIMISGAAGLSIIFPVVFLTMPPFPVLVVAMIFSGMSTSTLDALVNVGTEVTVGGWSSTFLIEARQQGASANALVSGFWAGIAFGRILLIPVTAWLGDEIAIIIYLLFAVGLQLLVWFVPNMIANAVALALLGVFLGPAFPCMIRVTIKTIRPRAHLTAAISFISTFSAAGMALLPLIVGLASQKASQGIKILPPMLVGLLSLQVFLWIASNKEYFVKRFVKKEDMSEVEDVDRLD
ncbi:uncharacterized protein UDID_08088 [Ustilago sp. UG-2017a]|nr:uncharacterized protein UDID_08088 [Ustilago sp. UG-2017a]